MFLRPPRRYMREDCDCILWRVGLLKLARCMHVLYIILLLLWLLCNCSVIWMWCDVMLYDVIWWKYIMWLYGCLRNVISLWICVKFSLVPNLLLGVIGFYKKHYTSMIEGCEFVILWRLPQEICYIVCAWRLWINIWMGFPGGYVCIHWLRCRLYVIVYIWEIVKCWMTVKVISYHVFHREICRMFEGYIIAKAKCF